MSPFAVGIIGFGALLFLFVIGVPIAFSMAIVGMAGFMYIVSPTVGLNSPIRQIFEQFTSYPLTVIPMFVLMGTYAFAAGIGRKLFNTAYTVMGRSGHRQYLGLRRFRRCLRFHYRHLRYYRPGGNPRDEKI